MIRIVTSLSLLLVSLLNFIGPALPASPDALRPSPVLAQSNGAIRAVLLYADDAAGAQAYGTLLAEYDFDVSLFQVAAPEENRIFLPLILRGAGETGAAGAGAQPLSTTAAPDFSAYDLVIVGPDTGNGPNWTSETGLLAALEASGLPVAGIGKGGYALFGKLDLDIGYPHGEETTAAGVRAADFGASQDFYTQPNALTLPQDRTLTLFDAPQATMVIPLSDRLPDGVRVASLIDAADQFPILLNNQRFLLWGFEGAPDAMTPAGEQLFANALTYLVSDLTLPIAGATQIPTAGFDADLLDDIATSGEPRHGYAQLTHIPSPEEREALAGAGLALQSYLGGTFYAVLVDTSFDPNDPVAQSLVRWLGAATPDLKVNPLLTTTERHQLPEGIDTALVIFFDDVSNTEATAILDAHTEGYTYYANQTWQVPLDGELIANLAQEEKVRWINPGPPPPQDTNNTVHPVIGTDVVNNAVIPTSGAATYLGLDGSGVVIGHFERKADNDHIDLAGSVTIGGNAHSNESDHATHVAGIMIGSGAESSDQGGTNRQWRGHAPGATIVAQRYVDSVDDFSDVIVNYGAFLSNHSYVMTYGTYDSVAAAVDSVVRGDATDSDDNDLDPHLPIWAAANQGVWAQYSTATGFYSIYSPAKNSLTVGSVDSTDGELSMFSSKGPTFDGRIKPDVMAPGSRAWDADDNSNPTTGIQSSSLSGGYTGKSGTSMAAPATTGVLALMLEQYRQSFGAGSTPRPATLKALLINTADDMVKTTSDASDDNDPDLCRDKGTGGTPLTWANALDEDCWIPYGPGPDYATGYGLINAVRAVAAVRGGMFLEDTLSPGAPTKEWTLTVPAGRDELRFTLAWDDEAGNASADATTDQLVNDLDLRLIAPDNTVHFPFTLDPLPAADSIGAGLDPIEQSDITDAYRGNDDRNNVEQVLVENPASGTWTVRVTIDGGFPTGDPQPFSLAGDARALNIVDPQTGRVAEAGDPADPNVILVIVEAEDTLSGNKSTLLDIDVGDFSVAIDGASADIVSGNAVGDQYWLNVRPQSGVYSAGSKYTLEVALNGYGEDTENNAVLFTDREITDRAIVIDTSGSMSDYSKMTAAQNAARLFIDQSLVGDRVAVVEFNTSANTPYPITEVSNNAAQPELNAAKTEVDALLPGGMTAIGQGLLAGQDEVTAPPADFSVADVLILLSDGMENIDPKYNTPAVKGLIEPTDTIIHTVAVGPSNAGHHALLNTIASDNGGSSHHVDVSGTTMAMADVEPAAVTAGTGIDAWPQSLPNRLGDAYKQIAEDMLGEHRLYQHTDLADQKAGSFADSLQVPGGLKRLTVALNWAFEGHMLRLSLYDPSGNVYEYDPQDRNNICRDDATHQTCIIEKPEAGVWRMAVEFIETSRDNEFALWASARTAVDFRLYVATPGSERTRGEPVHLLGYLHQSGKPLAGQSVTVNVFGPYGAPVTLKLADDGMHGDGQPNDGIYGGYLLDTEVIGIYAARGMAEGTDGAGDPFTRYDNATFDVRPRVLYVYDTDLAKALDYERLLEENGVVVDLAVKGAVPGMNLRRYNLVIIGPETGDTFNRTWEPQQTVQAIQRNEIPVLGLADGGGLFFDAVSPNLNIGWLDGAISSGTSINWNRQTTSDPIWRYSHEFSLPKEPLQLYTEPTRRLDIYLGSDGEPAGLTVFGYNDTNPRYADLTMDQGWYMLWSFSDGPRMMTDDGRDLFVNTVYRTMW